MFRKFALTAAVALAAVSLAACSGDDDGSDEEFVRDLCQASTELRNGIKEALENASTSTSPNAAAEALVKPLGVFVEAFDDLNPPKDLDDWHDSASDELEKTFEDFRTKKNLAALTGFADSPVPDPPVDAKSRLRAAAQDVPECSGVAFFRPD